VSLYNNTQPPTTPQAIASGTVGFAGGSQPHDNMVPFLVISFIISLFGIFPTQN
jgi:microcystin-dependent protein